MSTIRYGSIEHPPQEFDEADIIVGAASSFCPRCKKPIQEIQSDFASKELVCTSCKWSGKIRISG